MTENPAPLVTSGAVTESDGCGAPDDAAAGFPPAAASNYVPVAAMEAILACRFDQIHRYGHTLDHDREKPLMHFAVDIAAGANGVVDHVHFHKASSVLRRRLVRLGALCMAMIDRIDSQDTPL